MFNLYEIVQTAQNGQAIDNLAKQFNISPEEADSAVRALLPGLSTAFCSARREPAAFGSILGALGDQQHAAAFVDAAVAQSAETTQKGAAALQDLFGSPDVSAAINQYAASLAGLPPSLIQQMAPVIASMVIGGLSKGLANQGWGGVFGQFASAAGQGGLGSILGSLFGGPPAAQAQPAGRRSATSQSRRRRRRPPRTASAVSAPFSAACSAAQPRGKGSRKARRSEPHGKCWRRQSRRPPSIDPRRSPRRQAARRREALRRRRPAGFDPATVQGGLDALIKMLQPGTPPPPPASRPDFRTRSTRF